MAQRLGGPADELEVAEVGVGVEAAQVCGEEAHQHLVRAAMVTDGVELAGLDDRVGVEVLGVDTRKDLSHLEHRSLAAGEDRLGPLLDGLAVFAPVRSLGIPLALVVQGERDEAERRHVRACREHLAREVGVARVGPLFRGHDGDDGSARMSHEGSATRARSCPRGWKLRGA